jgi:ABC-type phosphate transport system substrate-binding protein
MPYRGGLAQGIRAARARVSRAGMMFCMRPALLIAALALGVAACGDDESSGSSSSSGSSEEQLSGTIKIDGSSTVFPFAEAAGELFNEE